MTTYIQTYTPHCNCCCAAVAVPWINVIHIHRVSIIECHCNILLITSIPLPSTPITDDDVKISLEPDKI